MKRREFITLLGGAAAAWPLAARAQQEGMRHIGVLDERQRRRPGNSGASRRASARAGRLGWSEGRNIKIDARYAWGARQAQSFAKELVALKPEVIFQVSTTVALALQRETRVIPVVFVGVVDPVGARLVASLARPGGNLTGMVLNEERIVGKWLAMLKEYAPNLARVAVLFNRRVRFLSVYYKVDRRSRCLARSRACGHPISSAADINGTIKALALTPNSGLLVPPDITAAAPRSHHRARCPSSTACGLAYGVLSRRVVSCHTAPTSSEMHRQAAYYVDRILRGTTPADLPVQAPTKYETTLNLKTAKSTRLRGAARATGRRRRGDRVKALGCR